MDYYKGSLYIYSEDLLYIYNLYDNTWTNLKDLGKESTKLIDYAQCIYGDVLYLIMGWSDSVGDASRKIYSINLSNYSYEFQEISVPNEGSAEFLFGYDYKYNLVYLFGGGSTDNGYFNNLSILDLSQLHYKFKILNEDMNTPTARKGHAMEAYNDKIYIFGGVDGNKKR